MKTFVYTFKEKGRFTKGRIRASNIGQARSFLKKNKLVPISLKEEKESFFQNIFAEKKVKQEDIVVFSQLYAGCLRMGLSIKDSLEMLSKQVKSKLLQKRLEEIIIDIEGGTPISTAFGKHTDIFPIYYPMLLKAGEASGDLSGILEYIGDYLERILNLRKELVSVFTYPAIVLGVGLGLLVVILIFVAPTFREVFAQANLQLPFITKLLFTSSDVIVNNLALIGIGMAVLVVGAVTLKNNTSVQRGFDRMQLSAPLIGKVLRLAMLLRFLRSFEILVNNNVPILQALQVLEQSINNVHLKETVTEMRKDVSRGLSISGPLLKAEKIVSPMIAYSVAMGEKSGNLGETLKKVSYFTDRDLNYAIKSLSARLGPALTLTLGIMVLFIALALYLPIFDMITQGV